MASPKYSHETVYVSVLLVTEFWLVRLFGEEWTLDGDQNNLRVAYRD